MELLSKIIYTLKVLVTQSTYIVVVGVLSAVVGVLTAVVVVSNPDNPSENKSKGTL